MEPRSNNFSDRKDLRFIGGTEKFDLYFRDMRDEVEYVRSFYGDGTPKVTPDYLAHLQAHVLRVHVVGSDAASGSLSYEWDDFRLPLVDNRSTSDGLIKGRWGDLHLDEGDAASVTAYVQCFAPWLVELGKRLTAEERVTTRRADEDE